MHYFVREKKIKYWELKCVLKVLINENNELKKNLSDYIAYIDRLQGVVWLFPPDEAMHTAIVRIFLASLVWEK